MRLFHVSEEPDIECFEPRLPSRKDLDPSIGLVWAISEDKLSNFLTPRNCPRVGYHVNARTNDADRQRFFTAQTAEHALVIEQKWLHILQNTTLYIYEFDPAGFVQQDASAGYYVSTTAQVPIARHVVDDLLTILTGQHIELRVVDHLWDIADAIRDSSLDWSLCRMAFAAPKPISAE